MNKLKPNLRSGVLRFHHRLAMKALITALSLLVISLQLWGRSNGLANSYNMQHLQQTGRQTLHSISGKVLDDKGEPLIGVTVQEKGTTNGTVTDIEGNFSFKTSGSNPQIVVSYVGFNSQVLRGANNMHIIMQPTQKMLDELVVVGYGVQRRASVTGSVESVEAKDLVTTKSANVTNALAGKLPGLRAIQRSGAPGDDAASVDIRGYGSALVIVDGVQRSFSELDPNDIESISILKDASAAVYGFKGANGVILVKTKSGQQGKAKITYTGYYGIQKITRYPELDNAYQYATLYNEAQQNIGVTAPYSNEQLESYRNGSQGTNWYEATIRKSAPMTYHNVNVSGGTDKVKYYFSFGLLGQSGIFKSKDYSYKRYNVRSNISAEIVKGFTVSLQLSGRYDKREKPYEADPILRSVQMALPTFNIYAGDDHSYYSNPGDKGNPVQLSQIGEVGYSNRKRYVFNGAVNLEWNIPWVKGLSAKGLFSYDYSSSKNRDWYREYYEYSQDANSGEYKASLSHTLSELTVQHNEDTKVNGQVSLNYHNRLGLHDFTGLLLWEFYNDNGDWFNAYRQFDVAAIDQLRAGNTTNMKNDGIPNEAAHEGLVGRINYGYADKYLAEFSFRYDGSYKFAPGSRWGFFPAVSIGWRISEENFFKKALPMIDNLKIRGSWGKIGDESSLSAFQYLTGYIYPSGSYKLGTTGMSIGAMDSGLANSSLTWYESKTTNIGFDGSAWKGLLSVEFDYFVRLRDGLLANRILSLPTTFGATLPQENLNSDKTQGFEISLGHRYHIGKDFHYDVKANFSTTRNYYRYVERAESANKFENWRNNTNDRVKGIQWGKVAIGQFKSYEEILNSPIQDGNGNKSLMPGDIKYEDWNNDGIIDDKDNQPIGRGTDPHIYYGLNITASYKNFDVSIFFQGAAGHEVFLSGDAAMPFIQQGLGNGFTIWENCWHLSDPSDKSSEWIAGDMPALRPTGFSLNAQNSTWSKMNASYLRLKTLEIGYTLPHTCLVALGISNCRFFVNGYNMFTFSSRKRMMKWMDPENSDSAYRTYPQMKTYNIGLTLTF